MRKIVVVLSCLASPAFAATGFAPGQWDHQTRLVKAEVPGVPQWIVKLVAGRGQRTSCYKVASRPEALLTQDDAASCKVRRMSMARGKILFDTFCTNKRFPDGLLVASRGTYTPTSYAISTTSTGTKKGKPVRIITTGTGKRLSNICRKG